MKRLLRYISLLCLFALPLFPVEAMTERDSLMNEIMSLPADSTRLNKIIEIARVRQTGDDFLFFIDLLQQEAEAQNDIKKINTSYYFRFVSYFNHNQFDSLPALWLKIKQIAYQEQDFYYYFNASRFLIESYYLQDHYEMAIDEGLKIKKEAMELNNADGIIAANLAITSSYLSLNRLKEASELLEEALSQRGSKELESRLHILLRLVSAYKEQKSQDHLLTSLNQLKEVLDDIVNLMPERAHVFNDYYLFMHVMYGNYYLQENQFKELEFHWQKASNLLDSNSYYLYKHIYYVLSSYYYEAKPDYARAIETNEQAMDIVSELHPSATVGCIYNKARLLALSDSTEEASRLYDQAFLAIDSISQEFSEKQVDRILSNYNIDRELYLKKRYERKVKIVLLVTIAFLAIIIFYYIYQYVSLEKGLRKSAQVINEARCKIEQANEEKNLFMRNICHDIRSYLNAIVGFSELISGKAGMVPDADKMHYQQIIEENSDQLTVLINNILELSRHEVGKMKFNEEEFTLMPLLSETVSVPVESDGSDARTLLEDLMVMGDRNHFRQVITSLFNNENVSLESNRFIRVCDLRKNGEIELHVYGSYLCETPGKLDVFTRNEINRCAINEQQGQYAHRVDDSGTPFIAISMRVKG